MASTTATHPKKKSILSAFALRRTDSEKNLQRKAQGHAFGSVSPLPQYREESTIRLVTNSVQPQGLIHNHTNQPSIDEMADALLDDTTVLSGGTARPVPGEHIVDNNVSHQRAADDFTSNQTRNKVAFASSNTRQRPVLVERPSSNLSRRPSKRNRRERTSSTHISATMPSRNLPRSRTSVLNPLVMNPLRMNPPGLSTSTSMPLAKIAEHFDNHPPRAGKPPNDVGLDVAQKIDMMLAATKALKPDPQPQPVRPVPSSSTVSKFRYIKDGLMRKVSTTFDRLHPRSHAKENREQEPRKVTFVETIVPPANVLARPYSVSSAHTRPNKDKIQRSASENAHGKHFGGGNKPLQHRSSYDDPFSESPRDRRPVTEFENRLRTNSVEDSVMSPLPLTNPFKTEKVLESSIDEILPSTPIASSTPRTKTGRFHTFNESPTKRAHGMIGRQDDDLSDSDKSVQSEPKPIRHFATGNQITAATSRKRLRSIIVFPYVPVVEDAERKKHPSPAKNDLEQLMKEFTSKYPDIITAERDEVDELASSEVTAPVNTDAAGDGWQLSGGILGNSNDIENVHGSEATARKWNTTQNRMSAQMTSTRKFRPLGIPRSQTESQLTIGGYSHHMDIDELQTDTPAIPQGFSNLGSQEVY